MLAKKQSTPKQTDKRGVMGPVGGVQLLFTRRKIPEEFLKQFQKEGQKDVKRRRIFQEGAKCKDKEQEKTWCALKTDKFGAL